MFTKLRVLLTLCAVFVAVGCSKNVKPEETTPGATVGEVPTDAATDSAAPVLGSTPERFSAEGSDSGSIDGLTTVFFDYDKSTLSGDTKGILKSNAGWMKKNPAINLQIEGHCDERGSVEYNLALGERRAKAVKSYLQSLGVEGRRMNIISYGKEKPIVTGDSESAYAKNRRANFVPLQ